MSRDNDLIFSFVLTMYGRTALYGKMFARIIESSANRRQTFDLEIFLHYLPIFQRFSPTQGDKKRNDGSFTRMNIKLLAQNGQDIMD